MKNRIIIALVILLFVCCAGQAYAIELNFSGSVFYRLPSAINFLPVQEMDVSFPADTVFAVPPRTKFPLATESHVLIASHSVVLYPGTVIRVSDGALFPLSGRISLNSEEDSGAALIIGGEKFIALYRLGEMHIEITPEQNAWLVMVNKGKAWLKDHQRKVVEFQPGTEIEIPKFGNSKVKQRASSRWISPPEVAVVSDVAAVFYPKQQVEQASDSQSIASDSQEMPDISVPIATNSEELEAISELSSDEVASNTELPASSAVKLD